MDNFYDRVGAALNDFRASKITLEQYYAIVAGTAPVANEKIVEKQDEIKIVDKMPVPVLVIPTTVEPVISVEPTQAIILVKK